MRLRDEEWTLCTFAEIVDGWVRAAGPKIRDHLLSSGRGDWVRCLDARIAEKANLSDADANAERLRLLRDYHAGLLNEIPPDTQWYRVAYLHKEHLSELLAISVWAKPGQLHGNELSAVVAHREEPFPPIHGNPDQWGGIFLWGHSREGPFTILDGNNRLAEYVAASNPPAFMINVYVGISRLPCKWHWPDLQDE